MSRKITHVALMAAIVLTVGLSGCKGFRWPWQKKPPTADSTPPIPITGTGSGISSTERPMIYGESDVERGLFQAIYFDYDSSVVKPREFSKVQAVATYMKANTGKKLLVEGHCDERGTAEYNRALGERRAQSARAELVRLGIPAERISTISYGKDRPVEPSHDETSWSKNRRCEFVIVR